MRPLVRCHLAELPQGLTAARAGGLWQVHEGSRHALGQPLLRTGAFGAFRLVADIPVLSLLISILVVLVVQAIFAIGEEAGWRGWLHGQLAPLGFWPMSATIGVMWALWHLPVVLALGLQGRQAVTYLVTIAAVAPLLAGMRELSGTAWAAVIGHGLFNSLRVGIDQNVLAPVDPALAWTLDTASWILWVAAAWVVLRAVGRPRDTGRAARASAGRPPGASVRAPSSSALPLRRRRR